MLNGLLELFSVHGLLVLGPILFVCAIGVPLPGTLLLVAAGAVAGSGPIPLWALILCATVATLLGNGVGYWIGFRGGQSALRRWGHRFHFDDERIAQARDFFGRYGIFAVLFSRFPLSPLSAIVNILAGTAHYPLRSFAISNLIGVTVWSSVYAGLGYAFGASWQGVANNFNTAVQWGTLVVAVVLAAMLILRFRKHQAEQRDRA